VAHQQALGSQGIDSPVAVQEGLRILVVDDNRDAAASMTKILEIMGNCVHVAYDGAEAITSAAEFRPQVVLLDIGLPIVNGYEVARAIRRESWGRDMYLVAVTGWGQQEHRQRSEQAGFDQHLVKPVDLRVIAEKWTQWIAESKTARVSNE
jgi:CheY-like chemotaxis protein